MTPIGLRVVYMRLSGMPTPYNNTDMPIPDGSIITSNNQVLTVMEPTIGVYRLNNTGAEVQQAINNALQLDPEKVLTTDDKILFDCETSEEI